MRSLAKKTGFEAEKERPALKISNPDEENNNQEYNRRISGLRDKFSSYVAEVRRTGAAGDEDIQNLEKGLQYVPEEDIEGWERFLIESKNTAIKMRTDLETFLQEAQSEGLISHESAKKWIDRFSNPTGNIRTREYFVYNELYRRRSAWRELKKERNDLATPQNIAILKRSTLKEAKNFENADRFKNLSYTEKVHVISKVKASLNAKEGKCDMYFHIVDTKLRILAATGIISSKKIGPWMLKIFTKDATPAQLEKFLHGSGPDTLSGVESRWRNLSERYSKVYTKLGKSEDIARGFNPMNPAKFLEMSDDHCISYLKEAERVLETSKNIDRENPRLLKIRHMLDIEDWEAADEEIRAAHNDELSPEDRSRLQSMRQFLQEHRTDGGAQKKESSRIESVIAAKNGIDAILKSMDGGMAGIAERLIPSGNDAVARWRWTVYNYVWCQKNGFVNQEKTQQRTQTYRAVTKERHEHQKDLGTNDIAVDDAYLRNDEHMKEGMKKGRDKATYQIVNLQNPNVASSVASWYKKSHDTKVLYWTTFVGCDNDGRTKSDGWHQQQFGFINQLRAYTKTLEQAGLRWRGRGITLMKISQDAPESDARKTA